MPNRRISIKPGVRGVDIGDGVIARAGQTVVVSEDEFDALDAAGQVDDLGTTTDPETGSRVAGVVTEGAWLSGTGAPGSPAVLPPDGVHDPWRKPGPTFLGGGTNGWLSRAYRVTWETGAVISDPGQPVGHTFLPLLLPGENPDLTDGQTYIPLSQYDEESNYLGHYEVRAPAGVGVLFYLLIRNHDADPDNVLNPADLVFDLRTRLVSGFTVGEEYQYPLGVDLGQDGDFYIDIATREVYGPKTAGDWGTPYGLDANLAATVTALQTQVQTLSEQVADLQSP